MFLFFFGLVIAHLHRRHSARSEDEERILSFEKFVREFRGRILEMPRAVLVGRFARNLLPRAKNEDFFEESAKIFEKLDVIVVAKLGRFVFGVFNGIDIGASFDDRHIFEHKGKRTIEVVISLDFWNVAQDELRRTFSNVIIVFDGAFEFDRFTTHARLVFVIRRYLFDK